MKDLIDKTRHNLMVIKNKACYNENGYTECYKCAFGQENSDTLMSGGWDCTIDNVLRDLGYYLSYFNNKETDE